MAGPVDAVTYSVFPLAHLARPQLAKLNPTFRMAKSSGATTSSPSPRMRAILVTYAKLNADILLQLTKCKRSGRFGWVVDNMICRRERKGHRGQLRPDYCNPRGLRPRHGATAVADPQDPLSTTGAERAAGKCGGGADPRWKAPARLLGFGNIPRLVGTKAQAFGMKVIAYDLRQGGIVQAANVGSVDFDTMLKTSYISVMRRSAGDAGMLNAAAFAKTRKAS